MGAKSFRDLLVWQKSRDITVDIYRELSTVRDYGFRDQIQRASVSIMNNVAEGYGKRSDKALANYLRIARGSAAEVESMLMIATDLGYLQETKQAELLSKITDVNKLLSAFMRRLSAHS